MNKLLREEMIYDIEHSESSNIAENRIKIFALESAMKEVNQAVEMEPKHHFSKDCYARELFIPMGTLLVGKIHKHESINILAQGEISILTDEGSQKVKAPYVVVSPPGVKRVGYAHSDCVWITVHATKETELDKIENEVIAESYEDVTFLSENQNKQLINIKKEESKCLG